jgi:hypothetical protein
MKLSYRLFAMSYCRKLENQARPEALLGFCQSCDFYIYKGKPILGSFISGIYIALKAMV